MVVWDREMCMAFDHDRFMSCRCSFYISILDTLECNSLHALHTNK